MVASVPNKFIGTTTQPIANLDANFDALVNYLNSLGLSYAALNGSGVQTFDVSPAQLSAQAVNRGQAYGLGFLNPSKIMPVVADLDNPNTIGWHSIDPSVPTLNAPFTNYGISFIASRTGKTAFGSGMLQYAFSNLDTGFYFRHENVAATGFNAWGYFQPQFVTDARYAALAGLSTQTFDVAPAVASDQAVNMGQAFIQAGAQVFFGQQTLYAINTSYTNTGSNAQFHYLELAGGASITVNFKFYLNGAWTTVATAGYNSGSYTTSSLTVIVPPGVSWQVDVLPTNWFQIQ